MKTTPYVILQRDDDDRYDDWSVTLKFPDVDGSMIWHLTDTEARDTRRAFDDYHSPLCNHGYALYEVVEPTQESRDLITNAIAEIKAREEKERANRERAEKQRLAALEARRLKAAEKKLQKATETKEQLYLRLKAEFEGEGK